MADAPSSPPGSGVTVDRVTIAAAAVVALAGLTVALRPLGLMVDLPVVDSAYYGLAVGRSLAEGGGLSADGVLPANGFQPLFAGIAALLFLVAGTDETATALRLVAIANWAALLGGGWLAGRIAQDAWPTVEPAEHPHRFWLGALLYLAAGAVLTHAFDGRETGLYLLLVLACWRWMQLSDPDRAGEAAGLGALLGLTVLARADGMLLVVALAVQAVAAGVSTGLARGCARAFVLAGLAIVVSSPWWLFNLATFGSAVPTAMLADLDWASDPLRLNAVGHALGVALMPWLYLGSESDAHVQWIRAAMIPALLFLVLRGLLVRDPREPGDAPLGHAPRQSLAFSACLAAAMAVLAILLCAAFPPLADADRLMAPAALPVIIYTTVAWTRLLAGGGLARSLAHVVAAAALLALPAAYYQAVQAGRPLTGGPPYRDQLALARAVPPGESIAAWQSGALGFVRAGVVDVSGRAHVGALARRDSLPAFLAERMAGWACDRRDRITRLIGADPRAAGWILAGERGAYVLYRRVPERTSPAS